jgi:5-formyltetrahydrofolate cyclo-ligase
MKKETLRKDFLKKMSGLSTGELEDKSQGIAAQLFQDFDIKTQTAIHIYLSIARNNEINTFHIINRLLKDFSKIKIGVPKCDLKGVTMASYEYNHDTKMKINKLGIPEPQNGKVILPENFSLLLVPLLCFDEKGYRVGYGKGFYDRYLKQTNTKAIKVGLSLFPPVKQISDANDFDVKLDYCITPDKVFKF